MTLLQAADRRRLLTRPHAAGRVDRGEAINVDGDRAAAMVAGAFEADALVILTNVRSAADLPRRIHADRRDPTGEADQFMQFAEGRMKKKVMGAVEAMAKASAK